MTGVQSVILTGTIMIVKNRLYYCEYFCDNTFKHVTKIALSLQDEYSLDYDDYNYFTLDGSLYDTIDVLVEGIIKTVLTTELTEIGE